MPKNIKKDIKKHKDVAYTSKDFNSLRSDLLVYARQHYGNKIVDLSESSVGGLFLDMAAYVGDTLSFYLDHQFNELSLETAIETKNIETLIRNSGVQIRSASPAFVFAKLSFVIPATTFRGNKIVDDTLLPKILAESKFTSQGGINFFSLEDIDFAEKDIDGVLKCNPKPNTIVNGSVQDFVVEREIACNSANVTTEIFNIDNRLIPFRTLSLTNTGVHEIMFVRDSDNDDYYEVDTLSQDTVYKRLDNSRRDKELVPSRLQIIPAPKRFIKNASSTTGKTTLRFGSGDEEALDEDIIPDPSEHAMTLYGDRKTFSKISIDPNSFLNTSTLGISPKNTVLTIKYSYGGGIDHNITIGELVIINTLRTSFSSNAQPATITTIRRSGKITNEFPAYGGENEPTIEQMRNIALLSKTSQKRVVTREDLLARVYNMPTNFGRVFRASVRDNPNNPFATQLHVISRNKSKLLVLSPDTLKENLSLYLSKFRLVSDAVDIVDAKIINVGIKYSVTVESGLSKTSVIQTINSSIKKYFNVENFHIDQPIITGEVNNIILNTRGVVSIISLKYINKAGAISGNIYSNESFSIARNLDRGMIFPDTGAIFELRYPNVDIEGSAV